MAWLGRKLDLLSFEYKDITEEFAAIM